MTHEELLKTIVQLPVEDRIALRDAIADSIDEHTQSPDTGRDVVEQLNGSLNRDISGDVPDSGNGQSSLSQALYGILQFESGPPTDEEVKDMITDYLVKKYY